MPYKINEYINDTRLAVRGRNLEQFFTDAFLGVLYMMKPAQKFAPEKIEREIFLEAIDTTSLLVEFLNETTSLASANKEFYTNIIFYRIQPTSLRAKLFGISIESFHREINQLAYHDAEVKQVGDGAWESVIIIKNLSII